MSQHRPASSAGAPGESTLSTDDRILRERAVNVIGHALQTPMATLRRALDVMALVDDDATRAELLDVAQRTAARIERLIDDALVAADVSTRLPTDRPGQVVVADAVRSAWEALAPAPPARATLHLHGDEGATATLSRDTLVWLLRLLLENAAWYGDGPVDAWIVDDPNTALTIHVRSGSAPLGDEELTHAFDLGYRGHDAVMRTAEGLGVGLGTASSLADHIGATVTLANAADVDGFTESAGVVATVRIGR